MFGGKFFLSLGVRDSYVWGLVVFIWVPVILTFGG